MNTVSTTGSIGRIARDLDNAIRESGGESCIAYGRGASPEGIHSIKIGSDIDSQLHGLLTRLTDRHGFGSVKSTTEFIKRISEYDPDIIHLHNVHGYYVHIEVLFDYIVRSGKSVVWTLHDCWPFTGHCAYFDYADCHKWKTGCFSCVQKQQYPRSVLVDNSRRNYENKKRIFTAPTDITLVCPSNWLAGIIQQSFLGKYPVRVINNGIDLSVFRPLNKDQIQAIKKKYQCEDKFVILGVANIWEERKGLRYFYGIAKEFHECQVIVVGLNERQKKALPPNIIGITRTNNVDELSELYGMSDVFVNPTLEDNYPTTNLEAMACGTPVITFDTGGSPESIDSDCGVIVEKGSVKGLSDAIRRMMKEPMEQAACLRKAQEFDKNIKYKEYIALYRQILK